MQNLCIWIGWYQSNKKFAITQSQRVLPFRTIFYYSHSNKDKVCWLYCATNKACKSKINNLLHAVL
jgi:hypothetical protein